MRGLRFVLCWRRLGSTRFRFDDKIARCRIFAGCRPDRAGKSLVAGTEAVCFACLREVIWVAVVFELATRTGLRMLRN